MSQGILHDRQAVLRSRLVGPGHAHTSAAGEAYVVKALDQTHAAKVAMLATRRVKAEHALRLAHPRYVYLGVFKGVSSTPVLVVEIDWDTPTPVVGTVSGRGSAVTLEQHLSAIEAVISAWRTHHRGTGPGGNELVFMGTGEPHRVREGRPGHGEDGLGIFVADKPLTAAALDPWQREAKHLVNDIVYGFASSPDGSVVVAATASGLYQRPPDPVAERPGATTAPAVRNNP